MAIEGVQTGDYTKEMIKLQQRGNIENMTMQDAARIRRLMEEQANKPISPKIKRWIEINNSEKNGVFGFIKATVDSPSAAIDITVQSIGGQFNALKSPELLKLSQAVGVSQGLYTGSKFGPKLGLAAYARGVMSTLGGGVETASKYGS